jgi:hypothetical protein
LRIAKIKIGCYLNKKMEDVNRKLVDEYDSLEKMKKEIENKIANIKSEMVNIAKINGISVLSGTHKLCSIKEHGKVIYPQDKNSFYALVKKNGLYDAFSQINYSRLSSAIIKKDIGINKEIFDAVKITKDFRVILIDKGI